MDFITGLFLSNGYTNYIVIINRLRKGVIFKDLLDIEAKTVANRFMRYFYRHHGLPDAITSDQGT